MTNSKFKTPIEAPEVWENGQRVYSPSNMPRGARGVPIYVQADAPTVPGGGAFVWWQILPGGDVTLWIEDGT